MIKESAKEYKGITTFINVFIKYSFIPSRVHFDHYCCYFSSLALESVAARSPISDNPAFDYFDGILKSIQNKLKSIQIEIYTKYK